MSNLRGGLRGRGLGLRGRGSRGGLTRSTVASSNISEIKVEDINPEDSASQIGGPVTPVIKPTIEPIHETIQKIKQVSFNKPNNANNENSTAKSTTTVSSANFETGGKTVPPLELQIKINPTLQSLVWKNPELIFMVKLEIRSLFALISFVLKPCPKNQ